MSAPWTWLEGLGSEHLRQPLAVEDESTLMTRGPGGIGVETARARLVCGLVNEEVDDVEFEHPLVLFARASDLDEEICTTGRRCVSRIGAAAAGAPTSDALPRASDPRSRLF